MTKTMETNLRHIALLSMALENKLDEQGRIYTLEQCKNADEKTLLEILNISFKSPLTGLLLHLFLGCFGVGRFYKGKGLDIAIGVGFIIGYFCVCLLFVYAAFNGNEAMLILACILIAFYMLAVYIDSYLVYKGIQKDNLFCIQEYLSKYSNKDSKINI